MKDKPNKKSLVRQKETTNEISRRASKFQIISNASIKQSKMNWLQFNLNINKYS